MPRVHEVNFDGLVGPTHNHAGLSYGNVASLENRGGVSSPKRAALEGLEKMRIVAELGVKQAVLPPQPRPDVAMLRRLGFGSDEAQVLRSAGREAPHLLAACSSASSMWAANAATVSPSADTADGRVHITPANLVSELHRSIESVRTTAVLRAVFRDERHFMVHDPLPPCAHLADEGAANHTRLCASHERPGVELFVYGREAFNTSAPGPKRFPARQTREASKAVARRHGLQRSRVVMAQQHPAAIDAGVFHNDVAAVGNEHVLLHHEAAFTGGDSVIDELRVRLLEVDAELVAVKAAEAQLPLEEAVRSYVFNSQLVTLPAGGMALVAPAECLEYPRVCRWVERVVQDEANPIRELHHVQTRQSMRNGGGPACLRLRVVLSEAQLAAMHPGVLWTPALHGRLVTWVQRHYRDELRPEDLADGQLLAESRAALAELGEILGLALPG